MPLKPGFSLYVYDLVSGAVGEYSANVEQFRLTSVSPGGYGQIEAFIKLTDANLLRPELAMFSRIAVMDPSVPEPHHCRFIGEINAPIYGMDQVNFEYMHLVGEGLGATLRDDPATIDYYNGGSGRTAPYILKDQMTLNTGHGGARSTYLPIDQDTSQIFPDNPGTVYAPAYVQATQEEVIQDIATKAGDYSWGVWAHPTNRDAAGFPTGQLVVHARDSATVTYSAQISDIYALEFRPDPSRSINVIELGYNDPTQNPAVGSAWYVSPSLAANGTQGSAPFRRRKYARNFAGTNTITKATAQALANTYGAQWAARVGFSSTVTLRNVRDANGNPIPLWQVQADANIAIPDLSRRILAFIKATGLPTALTAGVNLFYIRSAEYVESPAAVAGEGQQLTLTLDNFVDTAETRLLRLQAQADWQQRLADATTASTQASGAPYYGKTGGTFTASGGGQSFGVSATYGVTLTNTPPSISLDSTVENINVTGAGVSNASTTGFTLFWSSSASGKTSYYTNYHTVGNTILDVDAAAGTFAHHCQACEARLRARHGCAHGCLTCREQATRRGLSIWHDVVYLPASDYDAAQGAHVTSHAPGRTALAVWCSVAGCGASEHMHTGLRPEDENPLVRPSHHTHATAWRALLHARGHLRSEDWEHGVRHCTRPAFAPPLEPAGAQGEPTTPPAA